jgi:hypothetical protein
LNIPSYPPSVIRSIKQREMLNAWLRLARNDALPNPDSFEVSRLAEERGEMVYCDVQKGEDGPRFLLTHHGDRLSAAFGVSGTGKWLEDVVGARFAATAVPIYRACVERRLPVYSIYLIEDVQARRVAYERLLLPFSSDRRRIDRLVGSCKAISEDGAFDHRNMMIGSEAEPEYTVIAIVDPLAPLAALDSHDAVEVE